MISPVVYRGEGMTLKSYLRSVRHVSTRSLKRLKYRDGGITVNGERVTVRYMLKDGDEILLDTSDLPEYPGESGIIPVRLPLEIIYRDASVTVCDKPAGMPTHPVHDHLDDTAANALAYLAKERGEENFVFRSATRLDKNTSGLLLVANDFLSSGSLYRQVMAHTVRKTYLAVVRGVPADRSGTVDVPIARTAAGNVMRTAGDGDRAVTHYRVLSESRDGSLSLCAVTTETGRTHQIRVHLAHIGHPLLGDFLYGEESELIGRHALHVSRLSFLHPADGRTMEFTSPLPCDMADLLREYF